ncbi:MAG: HEAT repeat domain-containing protein [Cyanobacteria bacterium J06633_8]
MNLIKRITLHSQGNPQSVYEVNLQEVEEGKYEVYFTCIEFKTKYNYHTDGTKTKQPVSLEEAEKIFHRFIRDKKKRGYVDIFHTSDDSMSITQPFFDDFERKQVILERLENKKPSKWKLERAIWRAGELKITEATPLLINLLGTGEDLRDYCIAWSLGWCGDKSTIPVLTQLYENAETPEFVSRIAFEALLKLADEGTKARLQADLIASLPLELGRLARTSSPELFEKFAVNHPYYFFEIFEKIYQIDNPYIRASILKILHTVPFQPNYFRSIRRIFKIAEYLCDAEVFAILAYRFERVAGNFNNDLLTFSWDEEEEKKQQRNNIQVTSIRNLISTRISWCNLTKKQRLLLSTTHHQRNNRIIQPRYPINPPSSTKIILPKSKPSPQQPSRNVGSSKNTRCKMGRHPRVCLSYIYDRI